MKFLILFIPLFLFSCSKIQTGLKFAPRMATGQIDKAFDLESQRYDSIKAQIEADIQASQKDVAQKVIACIEVLEKNYLNKIPDLQSLILIYDQVSETQNFILNQFANSTKMVLERLTDKEISYFKKHIDEKFKDEVLKSKDSDAFLEKQISRFEKSFDFFLDDLTNEQEQMIRVFVKEHLDYFANRILNRKKFSEDIYLKMKTKEPLLNFFNEQYMMMSFLLLKDEGQKKYLQDFFEFNLKFKKTMSEKQIKYFKKTTSGYKTELLDIK
jgi:hypothetical protein